MKHPGEIEGKSTAVHAKLLAPDHVNIHIYPDIPDYTKVGQNKTFEVWLAKNYCYFFQDKAVLVFPGKESKGLDQFQTSPCDSTGDCVESRFPFTKIVFIDSTWNQCHKICQDERIQSLPQIMINSRQTLFWRYQSGKPKEYLSTIEAIYYLCVDFQRYVVQRTYDGEFDNLLFFFKFMYEKIHQLYSK